MKVQIIQKFVTNIGLFMNYIQLHYPGKRIEEGKVYVALNLMTLANLKTFHTQNNIYWIDGVLGKYYCLTYGIKMKKYPGREFLQEIFSTYDNNLILFGNKSNIDKIDGYFKAHYPLVKFKEEIHSINLSQIKNEIIIISLPSPLQEKLSQMLDSSNTIFCIGGALSMLSQSKMVPPKIIEILGLEFLWRLNTDTKRRLHRLLKSLFDLSINIIYLKKNYKPFNQIK